MDGSCRGNPGPGGWGCVLLTASGESEERCGVAAVTTNNRMELQAAIEALHLCALGARITSDSRYVTRGAQFWLPTWKDNNWRTTAGKPVKNADQWHELDILIADRKPQWRWVKGHTNSCAHHTRADELARAQAL